MSKRVGGAAWSVNDRHVALQILDLIYLKNKDAPPVGAAARDMRGALSSRVDEGGEGDGLVVAWRLRLRAVEGVKAS
jgi:hypothetical protein